MRVVSGCTLCNGDVLGDKNIGFYCKKCNLLFSSRWVDFSKSRDEAKVRIEEHFAAVEFESEITEKKELPKVASPRNMKQVAAKMRRETEKLHAQMDKALELLRVVEEERLSPKKKVSRAKKSKKSKKKSSKKKAKKVVKKFKNKANKKTVKKRAVPTSQKVSIEDLLRG